ncbi:MAG: hypothetical protein JWO71_1439 [Candidatus Acidoferrum typicum]|nr:hypothetical protein [Candidatus Acidoferrum typicum]
MDKSRRYDIVRRESEKAAFWLEGAPELSAAKTRVEELLSFWPGEYQIFDLETKEAVLTTSALCAVPGAMPVSNSAE